MKKSALKAYLEGELQATEANYPSNFSSSQQAWEAYLAVVKSAWEAYLAVKQQALETYLEVEKRAEDD